MKKSVRNNNSANRKRDEFYEAIRRDREAYNAALLRERESHKAELRRFREEQEAYARESRAEWAEIRKEWKTVTGEWGNFTNGEGAMVEEEGVPALRKLESIGGMPILSCNREVSVGRKQREYDGMLVCPKALVLLEFKRHFTLAHAEKFVAEQIPAFVRDYAPALKGVMNGHAVYGAIVGARVDAAARKFAEKSGLFVIRVPANRGAEIVIDTARPQVNGKAKANGNAKAKGAPKAGSVKTSARAGKSSGKRVAAS